MVYCYLKHIKGIEMEFHDVTLATIPFILCHFQMENAKEDRATASNFTATSSRSAPEETVHINYSEVRETIRRLQELILSLNLLLYYIPFWANYWRVCFSLSPPTPRAPALLMICIITWALLNFLGWSKLLLMPEYAYDDC